MRRSRTWSAISSAWRRASTTPRRSRTRATRRPAIDARGPALAARRLRDDIAADDRAGIEAALEAAGILDAWLTADGKLVERTTATS